MLLRPHVLTRGRTPTSSSSTPSAAHVCFSSSASPPILLMYKVYDGENTSSRLLGNFTRDVMLGYVINSTSNRLWLEFNSNASGTNQGFRLTYTSELSSDSHLQVRLFYLAVGFLWCTPHPRSGNVSCIQLLAKKRKCPHSFSFSTHHDYQNRQ